MIVFVFTTDSQTVQKPLSFTFLLQINNWKIYLDFIVKTQEVGQAKMFRTTWLPMHARVLCISSTYIPQINVISHIILGIYCKFLIIGTIF